MTPKLVGASSPERLLFDVGDEDGVRMGQVLDGDELYPPFPFEAIVIRGGWHDAEDVPGVPTQDEAVERYEAAKPA